MNRRWILGVAFVAALAIPRYVFAHEGHAHKVMGTVSTLHENHLEVKATDGKTSTITLNQKTKLLRGKAKVKVEDIKPGERVVVTATETKGKDGKMTMIATEVRMGAAKTARAEGLREPSIRSQQHEGDGASRPAIGVRDVGVLHQGEDGRARPRLSGPRDTRIGQER